MKLKSFILSSFFIGYFYNSSHVVILILVVCEKKTQISQANVSEGAHTL